MNLVHFLLCLLIVSLASCENSSSNNSNAPSRHIEKKELAKILDYANVEGSVVIYNPQTNEHYSNSFDGAMKYALPASTFKIANSIIGLELGILEDTSTVFKWDGSPRAFPIWEQDLPLKEAFQKSCVPCYQELAREIGTQRMNNYLENIKFGQMIVNDQTIDNFWLVGTSNINSLQQINFLERLYRKELPISNKTNRILRDILKIGTYKDFLLSGKTGFETSSESHTGWFVGYIERSNELYFFASRISPRKKNYEVDEFIKLRKEIVLEAFKVLEIIN